MKSSISLTSCTHVEETNIWINKQTNEEHFLPSFVVYLNALMMFAEIHFKI